MSNDTEKYSLGIDLGTTNTCVSIVRSSSDIPTILINEQGQKLTPSYLSFNPDDGELIVGRVAKEQLPFLPKSTLFDIKRMIGRSYLDETVEPYVTKYPFTIMRDNTVDNRLVIRLEVNNQKKTYLPEELSGLLLQRMRKLVEDMLGTNIQVDRVMISVPSYFNYSQRYATYRAGELAGFSDITLINEPTAAAVNYLHMNSSLTQGKLMVFDFGGGTLDLSIIQVVSNQQLKVLGSTGINNLGGEDLTEALVRYCTVDFVKKLDPATTKGDKYQNKLNEFRSNLRTMNRLRMACEDCKRSLTSSSSSLISLDCLFNGIDYQINITRSKFVELIDPVIKPIPQLITQMLSDIKLEGSELDLGILLVGGSSRIPKIKELLNSMFPDQRLLLCSNPDEAIANGAGLILSNGEMITIQETTALSLGLRNQGNLMEFVVPRHSPLPITRSTYHDIVKDGQTAIIFELFEGERTNCKNNRLVLTLSVDDLPAGLKRGSRKVQLTISIDKNGLASVTAANLAKPKSQPISKFIAHQPNPINNPMDLKQLLLDAEQTRDDDIKFNDRVKKLHKLEDYCYRLLHKSMELEQGNIDDLKRKLLKMAFDEEMTWLSINRNTTNELLLADRLKKLKVIGNPLLIS